MILTAIYPFCEFHKTLYLRLNHALPHRKTLSMLLFTCYLGFSFHAPFSTHRNTPRLSHNSTTLLWCARHQGCLKTPPWLTWMTILILPPQKYTCNDLHRDLHACGMWTSHDTLVARLHYPSRIVIAIRFAYNLHSSHEPIGLHHRDNRTHTHTWLSLANQCTNTLPHITQTVLITLAQRPFPSWLALLSTYMKACLYQRKKPTPPG